MRLSVDKSYVGYDPIVSRVYVTLDGERIFSCITADEELGEALCYVWPLSFVDDKYTSLKTELRTGKVVITFSEEAS